MSWLYKVREVENWMIGIPFALMAMWAMCDLWTGARWKHRYQMAVLDSRYMREVIAGLRRDVEVLHSSRDVLLDVTERSVQATERASELARRHQAGAAVAHAWRATGPERGRA